MPPNRLRQWLLETHGVQFELCRQFFSQQLALDLTSSDQARRFFVAIFAALGCIGPLIVRIYMPKYGYLQNLPTPGLYLAAVHADRLFFVSLSMIAVGLVTAVQWQTLFPDRQDYLILKPLPLHLYQIFVACFLAAFTTATIIALDLNLSASVLFPALTSGKWQVPPFGIHYVIAHAVATVGAGLFLFFLITAIQGVCLNLLSPAVFERLSVFVQAFLVVAFVTSGPYVLDMPNWYQMIAAKPNWMLLFPCAWFAGVYETLLGTHDAYFFQLSQIAVYAMVTTVAVTLGSYFLSYRRHALRVMEQSAGRLRPESSGKINFTGAICENLISSPQGRAVFEFATRTLQRSRRHKLLLSLCMGASAVLALQAAGPIMISQLRSGKTWSSWQLESIMTFPLVLGTVQISALCYVFQIPSELRANWVFRMAEGLGRPKLLSSVESLLLLYGMLPAFIAGLLIGVLSLGWLRALACTVLAAMLMLLLIELRLREWHKIPFTCSYVPGRRNPWQIIGIYAILFGLLIPTIAFLEVRVHTPSALLGAAAALSGVYLRLRSARHAQWRMVPLLFDEIDEPLIEGIKLSRE